MPGDIPEHDWRHFKEVRAVLLERFCNQVLEELAAAAQAKEGSAHDRYLRSYKLLEKRDEELARVFDDFRRSTAIFQLMIMRKMGLLTDDQLTGFSEETQRTLRGIVS